MAKVSSSVGGLDVDRLEAPHQGAVLLDVLVVVPRGGGADALDLAPGKRGLEDVRRVEGALGGTGADQRVDLVDEDDHVIGRRQLGDDSLEPLFELAAVLRAGHHQRQVQGEKALLEQRRRHLAVDDPGGEPLDDGSLAHAGLAEQHRIVLAAPREYLDHPLELGLATDQRVEDPPLGHLGQVSGELVEEGRLLLLRGQGAPLVDVHRVLADGVQAHAPIGKKARGGAVFQPQQAQQDVLGADVGVHQALGFLFGVLEDLVRFRAERDLDRGGELLAGRPALLELGLQHVHGNVGPREQLAGRFLAFLEQAEQQMLGQDLLDALLARLVAGKEEDAFRLLGKLFEHASDLHSWPRNRTTPQPSQDL